MGSGARWMSVQPSDCLAATLCKGTWQPLLYVNVRNSTIHRVETITVSEARAALPQILDRVLAGEEVTLTRHGKPVAVVVRPDTLRVRRADEALAAAERLRDVLARGRTSRLRRRPKLSEERADALVADVRAGRVTR